MNSRTIAIIIFIFGALVLAVVAALVFFGNQDTTPEETETTEAETTEPTDGATAEPEGDSTLEDVIGDITGQEEGVPTPEFVQVVVSLQTVPRGFEMTEDIITLDTRRTDTLSSNVITDTNEVIGLFARTDIFQGETLTRDSLVRNPTSVGVQEYGPSWLIPEGFIAAAIPIDLLSGVGFSLSEGDYIDILATFELYRIDEQFQTFLENDATFFIDEFFADAESSNPSDDDSFQESFDTQTFFVVPFGRFEELANGDLVLVSPSEFQRPIPITMVLQNAKIIQMGVYQLPIPASERIPTPTPEPVLEGEETPTSPAPPTATPEPEPPGVIVVALSPQQQLFLKHAIEVGADIDFVLRRFDDNQLYPVDQVDLQFLLEFFEIEVPPNFDYTIDTQGGDGSSSGSNGNGDATATPPPDTSETPEQ